jgi:hypothetical protein
VNKFGGISGGGNNNTRARRAWVRLGRAISKDKSNVIGQTLKVSRNHLPSNGFLLRSARAAAKVSLARDLVAGF